LGITELLKLYDGAADFVLPPEELLGEEFKSRLQLKRGHRASPGMYLALLAAKSGKLDAVLEYSEPLFRLDAVRIFSLPFQGEPLLASPFFTAIAEFAPWAYSLLAIFASAPLTAFPFLYICKPAAQMLFEL
jgi:hypothetical protein